jgi:hypothetical protein
MKNELIATNDVMTIAETFYKSGMFADIKSMQQAAVKIWAGAEMGISPFAAMGGIHIIQGKPTIGAGLMANRVKSSGKYDYHVIEMNDVICSIEFFQLLPNKESLGISTFSIDDAKKAGTKNIDRFPKNMLFARALSNGVKFYTPDVFSQSVYVPEEMGQITEDTTAEIIEPAKPTKRKLTQDQFQKMVDGIASGANVSNSNMPLYEWAITNCELSQDQLDMIENANNTNNNNIIL